MKEKETQEIKHLKEVINHLSEDLREIDSRLKTYAEDIESETAYLGEARQDMDHAEKINSRQSIEYLKISSDKMLEHKKRINKLIQSPYFGRFDFIPENEAKNHKIYIGIYNYHTNHENKQLIHDWRAPISSMFYNYETGPADYTAPSGTISGKITKKRQFRIRDGQLEFMLDSAVNIMDEVLQKELSQTSDEGMKNIVATIQRDQNAIIRNEDAHTLVIQGVAGSGKTSIALHRIAFLLYRFKETLTSEDILIISPNNVFADYISNVLPELGEETIRGIQMEKLADELLDQRYHFQTFFEQATELLENANEILCQRIQFKSSPAFIEALDEYAEHIKKNLFISEDAWIGRRFIPAWLFEEVFDKNSSYSKAECITRMTDIIKQKIDQEYGYTLKNEEKAELKKMIGNMHQGSPIHKTYVRFFSWIGRPEMYKTVKNNHLEYADVFPMIYLKMKLEEKSIIPREIKHLLIDEMQDYTPVQYAVISKLFSCNKTILGDISQSVNPYSSSSVEIIQNIFSPAFYVTLNKSYRSSYEITQFAQKISYNPKLEPIERHGDAPQVIHCKDTSSEIEQINKLINIFYNSNLNTLGIICKTQKQAEELFKKIKTADGKPHLLTSESTKFNQGVIICSAHMAKGLEFDQVLVPGATGDNYNTQMDRNLMYIACTRAMHHLILTHAGVATRFIEE